MWTGYRRWAPQGAWAAQTRLIISRKGSLRAADHGLGRLKRQCGYGLLHNPLQFP